MTSAAYTSTQKFLHWVLFVLVLLLSALTYGENLLPRGDPTVDAIIWRLHISFGLLLAGLLLWRVVLRGLTKRIARSSRRNVGAREDRSQDRPLCALCAADPDPCPRHPFDLV